jgi:anti-sigma factor RsiW
MTATLNVRDYACAKVRRRLDSYLSGELSVDLAHEILEHLDRCPGCRAELHARERLRAATRLALAPVPEPREGFDGEVRALLERTPRARRWPGGLLLAASLLLGAGLAGWLLLVRGGPAAVAPGVARLDPAAVAFAELNHRNCTLRGAWPEEAQPLASLEAGLGPRLAAALAASVAALPGYRPVSAHECEHAGETVFHVVFRRAGSSGPEGLLSVLVTRPGSPLAVAAARTGLLTGRGEQGLEAVGTASRDGRLLLLVVPHGSGAEALALGRAVLPALATAFAR